MAYYQAGNTVTGAANLVPFIGAGTFLAADVSALDTSGGLAASGAVDGTVFLVYTYTTPGVVLPSLLNGGVTIKMVGSLPAGTTCSAAAINSGDIAGGLLGFGTTLHLTPIMGSYATTETPFLAASLSASELTSLTGRCSFILGNSSGAGICGSCVAGGQ